MALSLGDKINASQKRGLTTSNRGTNSASHAAGAEDTATDKNDE